jgi:hypothetical protein
MATSCTEIATSCLSVLWSYNDLRSKSSQEFGMPGNFVPTALLSFSPTRWTRSKLFSSMSKKKRHTIACDEQGSPLILLRCSEVSASCLFMPFHVYYATQSCSFVPQFINIGSWMNLQLPCTGNLSCKLMAVLLRQFYTVPSASLEVSTVLLQIPNQKQMVWTDRHYVQRCLLQVLTYDGKRPGCLELYTGPCYPN